MPRACVSAEPFCRVKLNVSGGRVQAFYSSSAAEEGSGDVMLCHRVREVTCIWGRGKKSVQLESWCVLLTPCGVISSNERCSALSE